MGTQWRVTCRQCGTRFEARDGGGFAFHMLHCEQCGREHAVDEQQMGTTFRADGPALDAWIVTNIMPCLCGGRFTLDAKARCPRCKSDDWDESNAEPDIEYD